MCLKLLTSACSMFHFPQISVLIYWAREKGAPFSSWAIALSLLHPAGMHTFILLCVHHLEPVLPQPLKSSNQPEQHKSIPPNILTLTTSKSPLIPDILLRCHSSWSSQRNSLTKSSCEAEDKANLLNEIQVHDSSSSVYLTFPPSPSNPPSQSMQPTSNPIHTHSHSFSLLCRSSSVVCWTLQNRVCILKNSHRLGESKSDLKSLLIPNQNAQATVL